MSVQEQEIVDAVKKAGKPVRPGDIARITGQESKDVSKVIAALRKKGTVISPKRCYYALADDV